MDSRTTRNDEGRHDAGDPVPLRVAAFTEGVLEGNPAGVVTAEQFPDEHVMQRTAAALGFAETAFAVRAESADDAASNPAGATFPSGESHWRIRYFSPKVEVELCGHATLATAFVLWERGLEAGTARIRFDAPGGCIVAERDGSGLIRMDMPADDPGPALAPGPEREHIAECLGLSRFAAVHRTRFDLLIVLDDEKQVTHYHPGSRIGEIEARGVILTAPAPPGRDYDFVSRFFAPRCGIPEDPVTGSAHCCLVPFWSARVGRTGLSGYQASDRGGLVHGVCAPGGRTDRVLIGGHATMM